MARIAANCSPTRQRMNSCERFDAPSRSILARPRMSTTATAPMAIATAKFDATGMARPQAKEVTSIGGRRRAQGKGPKTFCLTAPTSPKAPQRANRRPRWTERRAPGRLCAKPPRRRLGRRAFEDRAGLADAQAPRRSKPPEVDRSRRSPAPLHRALGKECGREPATRIRSWQFPWWFAFRSPLRQIFTRRQNAKAEGFNRRMPEMPVARQNDICAARQSAIDIGIVLGVFKERTKTEPRLDKPRARAKRVENAIDLRRYDPRRFAQNARSLQDILIF